MLTTNQKGAIAEAAVIYECTKRRIAVSKPFDDQRYDLVLDLGSSLLRVQCKWCARDGDVIVVRTRRCRRTRDGQLHRSYAAGEIDAIAAYCVDNETCYLLPPELSCERAAVLLRLEPAKNNQSVGIRWARDYEFGATLRALGP